MRVKNKHWIDFKSTVIKALHFLDDEFDKFEIPEDDDDFEMKVNDVIVYPTFINKPYLLRVEYDFTLCSTTIRTLAISKISDTYRIEFSLKNTELPNE